MESILDTIKKLLGGSENDNHFDTDLIIHINSVFMILNQLGVGPEKGFSIKGSEEKWSEFIKEEDQLEAVKTYIYLKVRNIFDPPQSSAVLEAINKTINELEWRLQVGAENSKNSASDIYTGEYEVTPKANKAQVLDTSDKLLKDDIIINEVPYYETTNASGGMTTYIAKE